MAGATLALWVTLPPRDAPPGRERPLGIGTAAAPLVVPVATAGYCTRRIPTIAGIGCPPNGRVETIDLVVIHHCGVPFAECLHMLTTSGEVSAHYLIAGDGRISRLVADVHKAYHATYVNPRSIGIELDGSGGSDYTDPMYEALAHLLAELASKHGVPLAHPEGKASSPSCLGGVAGVIGHYQVQPAGAEACGYPTHYVKHDPVECHAGLSPSQCFQWDRVMARARRLSLAPR